MAAELIEASKTCRTLEKSLIEPQADNIEHTLSLSSFDIAWIHLPPIQRLLFYKFPCSKLNFLRTIVPSFKTSLSKTLKHYLPLSGNLCYPYPTHEADDPNTMPEIRYKPGDSVPITVAEYSGQENPEEYFDYLTGDSPRDCDKFYDFVPDLPDPRSEPGFQIIPLLAVQLTLFPGIGICLGLTNHHVVGDAGSMVRFMTAWSRVAKFGEEEISAHDRNNGSDLLVPIYDRSLLKDPKGLRNSYWNSIKNLTYRTQPSIRPKDKVRATYVLQDSHVQKLKNTVRAKKPYLTHLSSFTVATAYVWTCLVKSSSGHRSRHHMEDDETEHFTFGVDTRTRVDPPLPLNYFGNFVGAAFMESTQAELTGKDGFFTAAELISNVISNEVGKKGEILRDAENWPRKFGDLARNKRWVNVAGSPKFDHYVVDFGWGKPVKYELLAIDGGRLISLSKSGEFEGGLEIGLALPKEKMEAFDDYFYGGLETML